MAEILQLFRTECPRLVEQLHHAVARRDAPEVRRLAHTLQGTLGNLSASDAYAAALRLEELGRAGDLAGVEVVFATLRQRLELLDLAVAGSLTGQAAPSGV
jgi:HPt (histidine-containing phosphotransfer) domain-containing protein